MNENDIYIIKLNGDIYQAPLEDLVINSLSKGDLLMGYPTKYYWDDARWTYLYEEGDFELTPEQQTVLLLLNE